MVKSCSVCRLSSSNATLLGPGGIVAKPMLLRKKLPFWVKILSQYPLLSYSVHQTGTTGRGRGRGEVRIWELSNQRGICCNSEIYKLAENIGHFSSLGGGGGGAKWGVKQGVAAKVAPS